MPNFLPQDEVKGTITVGGSYRFRRQTVLMEEIKKGQNVQYFEAGIFY